MAKKPSPESDALSDKEAEQRATDALRRALTTAYKPQSDLKVGRKPKKKLVAESSTKRK